MLGKLLKYEMKASGRILLPIFGAVLIMGALSSVFMRMTPHMAWGVTFMNLLTIVFVVLFVGLIVAALCLSFVISIMRFKKNLLGEEGYFMHTLPVSTWQNITAKTLVAACYQIISFFVAIAAGLLFATIGATASVTEFFHEVGRAFRIVYSQIGNALWLYAVEVVIFALICLLGSNMMIYASMSVGHAANSRKVLLSVAAFLGFYIIGQIINSFLYAGFEYFYNLAGSYSISALYRPQPAVLALTVLEIAYLAAYFFVTSWFLKRRLNLQ